MRIYARIIIPLLLTMLVLSCTSVRYVPVETIKVDTTYISKIKIDSIYQRDSIYIEKVGDTVYKYKYKYIDKYTEIHDTLWREKVDTVPVIHTVEAQLSKWQKAKMNMGSCLIGAIILSVIIFCVRYFIKQ